MVFVLERSAVEAAWPALLALRELLRGSLAARPPSVWFRPLAGRWELGLGESLDDEGLFVPLVPPGTACAAPSAAASFRMDRFLAGQDPLAGGGIPLERLAPFRLYLPPLLGGACGEDGRAFVTAHLAQSLDGRIACRNGASQWIGNGANLEHAHRLRALHDAVLVGRRTVERDDPRLTVRAVAGSDPARVVLSGSGRILASWRDYRVFADGGATVLCGPAAAAAPGDCNGSVTVVGLPSGTGERLAADAISRALFQRGFRSAFVEGGGVTVSSFVEAGRLDLLHLHVAPLLLGAGVEAFTLPEVQSPGEARRLRTEHFLLEGELLVECRLVSAAG